MRSKLPALALFVLLLAGLPATSAAQDTHEAALPHVVVTLHDGSKIVGEMVAQNDHSVTIHTALFGQLLIPRTNISEIAGEHRGNTTAVNTVSAAHADTAVHHQAGAETAPTMSAAAADSAQWTRTLNLSANYASATVSGYNGETKGAQLELGVTRVTSQLDLALKITAAYQRTDPNPESVNDASFSFIASHKMGGPWSLRSETLIEHNRVEELDYRIFQHIGIGWTPINNSIVTLLLTPGVGYTEEHGAGPELLAGQPRQKFKDDRGFAVGIYEQITLRLPPAFTITQDFISFHATDDSPRLQYTGNLRLLGMVSKHVGMTIEYKREFDSAIPLPINKTLERLSAGVQLSY